MSVRTAGNTSRLNRGQIGIVSAPVDESLFVIAGPGSGKTTASASRILKLLFVDGLEPHEIIGTTFTRRVAAVLRSRIAVQDEILQGSTRTPWPARPEVRTCTACDFKYRCPDAIGSGRNPQIP